MSYVTYISALGVFISINLPSLYLQLFCFCSDCTVDALTPLEEVCVQIYPMEINS